MIGHGDDALNPSEKGAQVKFSMFLDMSWFWFKISMSLYWRCGFFRLEARSIVEKKDKRVTNKQVRPRMLVGDD